MTDNFKPQTFDVIAFDADDTLWHNESLYAQTQEKYRKLLRAYAAPEQINQTLFDTEMRNLQHFGYGIKSFTLSMLETAVTLADGQISGREVQTIINFAKEMFNSPTRLLDQVEATIANLAPTHTLMLITKGDLLDQEAKLARSGLAGYFQYIEVVSHKTSATYANLLDKYHVEPARFLMVGNSLKSDVLPVVEIGGTAVFIPYHITWDHEIVPETEQTAKQYVELDHIGQLVKWVAGRETGGAL